MHFFDKEMGGTFLWRYYISTKTKLKNLQLSFQFTFENIGSLNI